MKACLYVILVALMHLSSVNSRASQLTRNKDVLQRGKNKYSMTELLAKNIENTLQDIDRKLGRIVDNDDAFEVGQLEDEKEILMRDKRSPKKKKGEKSKCGKKKKKTKKSKKSKKKSSEESSEESSEDSSDESLEECESEEMTSSTTTTTTTTTTKTTTTTTTTTSTTTT